MSAASTRVEARPAGLIADIATVGRRAIRILFRDPEAFIPPVIIGAFLYFMNVGSLQRLTEASGVSGNYKAFQVASAAVFSVTGLSRAASLVTDLNNGYFDRLMLSPARRISVLIGLLMADFVTAIFIVLAIEGIAVAVGVRFATGILGMITFALLAAVWSVVFAGFSYAIALKTANPAAVNNSFLLFFPFAFATTTFVPKDQLAGWLNAIANVNPVTYLLDGWRGLVVDGWDGATLGKALIATVAVGVVSIGLALAALNGRIKQR
jgi:ABC-2 type transport system permease protein